MSTPACNHLVASDLHLTFVYDDEDHATDAEFSAFLDHYRQNRVDDRPWRLVLAGDVFDLLYPDMELFIRAAPGPDAPPLDGVGFLEHWDIDAIAWRLGVTMRQRAAMFVSLARFLLAGNSVAIIKGNHDGELQWAKVQNSFREALVEIACEAGLEVEPQALNEQVSFCDWFYLSPGELYVEHGNQYDEFNAFPNFLDPALVHDPNKAFMPMGSRMTQYLSNAFLDYKPGPAHGTFMGYIWRTGQLFSRKFLGRSWAIMSNALGSSGLFSEEGWRTGSGKEDHALQRQSERTGVPVEQLQELQQLQIPPATAVRGFFFNRMMLDRLFVLTFGIAMILVAVGWGLLPWNEPALLAVACVGPLVGIVATALRFALRKAKLAIRIIPPAIVTASCIAAPYVLEGGDFLPTAFIATTTFVVSVGLVIMPVAEMIELHNRLRRSAGHICRILDVPVIVFGHHHRPDVRQLREGGLYMNSGAWVNTGLAANHAHVTVVRRPDGSLDAELRRGRDFLGAES